ncbi:ribosomal protein, partial [Trifolium pratense]
MRMLAYGMAADAVDEYIKIGGQFTRGGKGTTTVILEAVASHDLWIWHAIFESPGTLNVKNILDRSPVFDDVEQRNAPTVNFFVNQRPYNMTYYLAD